MPNKKYLQVTERIEKLSANDLDGSLSRTIAWLQSFLEDNPDHTDVRIEYQYDHDEYESGTFYIIGERPETDSERDKRLGKLREEREKKRAAKEKIESKERETLRKLLEKYPDEA